ncbi:RNase adapter RapZ [Geovibrio thiophilus]|uniref:RNase adapter RapZ n=1 Tax=Geovibrio thiophilus TaxID=139438 RepID=A0A3R5UYQ1_9BACT|nr:RNase adapter RapZ [Geovibrio thiophilus]QAR33054.1 RNase adapter RapZ [Geovibrio thiophilus]
MQRVSLVVLTGLSGAGKSRAADVLEDLGYYTVDNFPPQLLEKFLELIFNFNMDVSKVALVIDIRSRNSVKASEVISLLKNNYGAKVLFIEADNATLIKRYKETRRTHPLGSNLPEAIDTERESLREIRETADIVIDTSRKTVHELARQVESYFMDDDSAQLSITVQSFGFKYGVPEDSDLLFDVRFLKNPHFEDDLREKTGREKVVQDYVFSDEKTGIYIEKIKDMLNFLIPNYLTEGKRFLTVSVGCTGGKHRSVAIAENLSKYLKETTKFKIITKHRDMDR